MQNAALLLAVAFIFDLIANRWRTGQLLFSQVPVGLAIGAICITIMMTPWIFAPGIVFDTRSVLIGISGLFFGSLTVAIVMGMTAAFRYYQGGAAAWTGIAVILISGVIGIVWRHLRRRPISDISWRELYLFGLVIHLAMLVTMFTLPWQIALQVLSNIALPVIIIYPAGTALLGVLMVNRVRRERSDDALKESEEKYRSLVENINDMIYTLDSSGRFTYVSPVIEKFSSYKASDLVGRNFAEFVHPDDLPGLVENFNLTVQGELNPFEYRILEGDKIRHVRTSSELILKDGVVVGLTGVLTDISEQKQAENGLQKSERQMEDIIEFLPDATLAINREGRVIIWNKAIEEMTGVPAAEMIGKGDYAYTIPFYGEARPQLMDLVFDDQHDIAAKYPQITHEGDTLLIEVFCHALYKTDKSCHIVIVSIIAHDS
jgi:PAS domain S-box-containing protein